MPWGNDGNWHDNNDQGPWGRRPAPPPDNEFDDFIRKSQEQFKKMLSQGGGNGGRALLTPKLVILALLAAVLVWFSTGFFIVEEGWRGVVLRFGEYSRLAAPGPNYHLPSPIETVTKVPADLVNIVEIGFRGSSIGGTSERSNPSESLMLTGDENIVDVRLVVQWDIKSAPDYLFNVRELNTVKSAAESAVREVIGSMTYREAIEGTGRDKIAAGTKELLQSMLDNYHMGVNIRSVQIKQIDPPAQVIDAFRDVQTARADKEREINQADAYRNDVIPKAKGDAARIVQEAEAYKNEVTAHAKGEAQRFTSVYNQYVQAKDVTKKRMYLETMEDILAGTKKVVIDENAGSGVVPYLPLPEIEKRKQ